MRPSIGRVVHYQSMGTANGEYQSECRAAMVTGVTSDTYVDLCVMNPTGLFFREDAPFDDHLKSGGTWHWPERVD